MKHGDRGLIVTLFLLIIVAHIFHVNISGKFGLPADEMRNESTGDASLELESVSKWESTPTYVHVCNGTMLCASVQRDHVVGF